MKIKKTNKSNQSNTHFVKLILVLILIKKLNDYTLNNNFTMHTDDNTINNSIINSIIKDTSQTITSNKIEDLSYSNENTNNTLAKPPITIITCDSKYVVPMKNNYNDTLSENYSKHALNKNTYPKNICKKSTNKKFNTKLLDVVPFNEKHSNTLYEIINKTLKLNNPDLNSLKISTKKQEEKPISKVVTTKIDNVKIKNKKSKTTLSIPIILSESNLDISLNSKIEFNDSILEITNIKNNVYITEITILPTTNQNQLLKQNLGKVFLKGIVRQNIEYSTLEDNNIFENNIVGQIKHMINYIPFERVVLINFSNNTSLLKNFQPISIINLNPSSKYTTNSYTQKNILSCNTLSNKIYCQLKQTKIINNIKYNKTTELTKTPIVEFLFNTLTENLNLNLTLLFTQNQLITI